MWAIHNAIKSFIASPEAHIFGNAHEPVFFTPAPTNVEGYWVHYSVTDAAIEDNLDVDAPYALMGLEVSVVLQGNYTGIRTTPAANKSLNYFQWGGVDFLLRLADSLGDLLTSINGIGYGSDETDFQVTLDISVEAKASWAGEPVTVEDLLDGQQAQHPLARQ